MAALETSRPTHRSALGVERQRASRHRWRAKLCAVALALATITSAAAPARAVGTSESPAMAFVRFEPMLVSLFADEGIGGLMSVTVQIKVSAEDQREIVEAKRPKLIDRFNQSLILFGQYYANPRRPVDIRLMAQQLQLAADGVLGKGFGQVLVLQASIRAL